MATPACQARVVSVFRQMPCRRTAQEITAGAKTAQLRLPGRTGRMVVRMGSSILRSRAMALAAAGGACSSASAKVLLRVSFRSLGCMAERPVTWLRLWLSNRCSVGSAPLRPEALPCLSLHAALCELAWRAHAGLRVPSHAL